MAPRGRPKNVVGLTSSTTSSRSTSRRATAKAPPTINNSGPSTVDGGDDDDESIFDLQSSRKKQPNVKNERRSISSLTSFNDAESSGYSTPATSAIPTPATQSNTSTARRTRGQAAITAPTPAVNAVKRAAALRNSGLSLTAPSKRKRATFQDNEDEDEDEDVNEDNTADAQLARALQRQEDASATAMNSSSLEPSRRRTSQRKIQKILPKLDFVSDLDDDDMHDIGQNPTFSPTLAKRPKVELGSRGSNAIKFKVNRVIEDSEESNDFPEIQDSEEDEEEDDDEGFDALVGNPHARRGQRARPSPRRIAPPPRHLAKPMANAKLKSRQQEAKSSAISNVGTSTATESEFDLTSDSDLSDLPLDIEEDNSDDSESSSHAPGLATSSVLRRRRAVMPRIRGESREDRRARLERTRLEAHHPELQTMWTDLEELPVIDKTMIEQPDSINRELKPFQLEGVAWMKAMEETEWGGGLLGDEMGMGKTIQAVTLIMSDFPHPQPTLVLIPPVALMQWQQEIADYTNGTLKTFVFHGTNAKTKNITVQQLKKYNVILMSYNSLESMYRKQEKGFKRKDGIYKEESVIHKIRFHRAILDEAHNIKQRTSGSAKACFALKADHKWCLSGTPLQNRIGEFFSLIRFLDIKPFACYFCKSCPCANINWDMDSQSKCKGCSHSGMQHVSVFNQELLNPIVKYGNTGPGQEAFRKLRLLTDRFMLRRVKRDHSSAMELPAKEIYVDRHFFGEEENDFASSIMNSGNRKFETYVAQGVMLNNYANIFGLIMQMRQVADHPDLILKKNSEGGQNILVCCICDDTAEEAIRSSCRHDFCRECAKDYLKSADSPDCPQCHIALAIDLEQPEIEQDEQMVKKSSIINRIKMENWTSSSKIEALVHDLWQLRSKNGSTKSIIFSNFTTMLQLVEWRLRRAGITTVMLDGSMTPAQRQASINKFMTDVNIECFLVSLKAGGVALNLTEASKVFIVDPWWNPAAEWQSADRCHRIGQGRPCSITRLCIEDSVESRMVLLQEKKANMINSTINADMGAMESLTTEDMQFLFRGT